MILDHGQHRAAQSLGAADCRVLGSPAGRAFSRISSARLYNSTRQTQRALRAQLSPFLVKAPEPPVSLRDRQIL